MADAMKIIERRPCRSCPYRRDVKVELWHPDHFRKLLEDDLRWDGAMYGCHAYAKRQPISFCAGWLLDQKRRNLPCLRLRHMFADPEFATDLHKVRRGRAPLYDSIEEMCEANGVIRPNPHGLGIGALRYLTLLLPYQHMHLLRMLHKRMKATGDSWSETVRAAMALHDRV